MQASLALPEPPRSIGDILRRVQGRAEPAVSMSPPSPAAETIDTATLPLQTVRTPRWHRHELAGGAYELRAHGDRIVRVAPTAAGWRVDNIGAGTTRGDMTAAQADALAARIARMVTAG